MAKITILQRILLTGCIVSSIVGCTVGSAYAAGANTPLWQQRYQAFTTELSNVQIFQYFQTVLSLDTWPDKQRCTPEHITRLEEALALNTASLHLRYTRYQCWQTHEDNGSLPAAVSENGEAGALASEADNLSAIAEVILASGQGVVAQGPIIVRELSDATAIFELAEYDVVEMEMLMYQQQVMLRYYLRDRHSNIYQYRYVSGFAWLAELMQRSGVTGSAKEVSAAAYQQYLQDDFDFALLYRAKQDVLIGKGKDAAKTLASMVARSYLATTALAQLYVLEQDMAALDALLPELITAHEAGEPSASAMLALLVLLFDDSAGAPEEAQQLLDAYGQGYESELRQEMLLDLMLWHPNYQVIVTRWLASPHARDIKRDALQRVLALWHAAGPGQQQKSLSLQPLLSQRLTLNAVPREDATQRVFPKPQPESLQLTFNGVSQYQEP